MMVQFESAAQHGRLQPKVLRRIIRNMVIVNEKSIEQSPSMSLLVAMMDIIDTTAERDCMSREDRAGMKQMLLAASNYTL